MKKFLIIVLFLGIADPCMADEYSGYKKYLKDKFDFDYGTDISFLEQRGSPNGKDNAVQLYVYPYFSWKIYDSASGDGILNFAYSSIDYGHHQASDIMQNTGMVSGINDYVNSANQFSELYLEHRFNDMISFGIGQFPIYNFDGSEYNSNQQLYFINVALSQNASATYTSAGIGGYMDVKLNSEWSLIWGGQDGTNINARGLKFNDINKGHFTTFGTIERHWDKNGKISILVYNQPNVKEQRESTNGWSLNYSKNINEKIGIFIRANGVSGHVAEINQSYVVGGVYNHPFNCHQADQFGIAFAYNRIDEKAFGKTLEHHAEQVLETFVSLGIGERIIVSPDIQIYFNPANNQKSDIGVVASLRTSISF